MNEWISSIVEPADNPGVTSFLAVREDVEKYRSNPRFHFRVEVTWKYAPDATGMPFDAEAAMMEKVQEAAEAVLKADPVAVLTETSVGGGERCMMFYTLSLHIFQRKINEILAPFPELPLTFEAVDDPDWEEYQEALALVTD